jgi:hypothetical protein
LQDKGIRPLENLQTIELWDQNPEVWEYLSRMGVKLKGVKLVTIFHCDSLPDEVANSTLASLLDVVAGPQLLDFSYHAAEGKLPFEPILQAAVQHPRRSLDLRWIDCEIHLEGASPGSGMSISQLSAARLERLSITLASFPCEPVVSIFSRPMPCLRHLSLVHLDMDDAAFAMIIRGVSPLLESLRMEFFPFPCFSEKSEKLFDQTASAMVVAQSLRKLVLICDITTRHFFTYSMREPILIGIPPGLPPLCPRIREADIQCEGDRADFNQRLRMGSSRTTPCVNHTTDCTDTAGDLLKEKSATSETTTLGGRPCAG